MGLGSRCEPNLFFSLNSHICEQQTMRVMSNRDYTIKQEQIARFAKAMGHPARIAILQFLAIADNLLFW